MENQHTCESHSHHHLDKRYLREGIVAALAILGIIACARLSCDCVRSASVDAHPPADAKVMLSKDGGVDE